MSAEGAPREDGPGTVIYIASEQGLSSGELRDLNMSISQAYKAPMYGILLYKQVDNWIISLYSPIDENTPPVQKTRQISNWMTITDERLKVIDTQIGRANNKKYRKGNLSLYGDCSVKADKITKYYRNGQPSRRNEIHFDSSVVEAIKEEIQAHVENRRRGGPRNDKSTPNGPGKVIHVAHEQELSPGCVHSELRVLFEAANKWFISLYSPNLNDENTPTSASVDQLNWMTTTSDERLKVVDREIGLALNKQYENGYLSLYGDCFVPAHKVTKYHGNNQPTKEIGINFDQSVVDAIKEEIQAHIENRPSRKPTPPPEPSQPKTPASLPSNTVHDWDGTCNINFF
ncbi:hypothetical protein H0H93_009741 [Arthromyces matolae]|nr:hypothetical protein H0H93_009741 [Arthromyces matolae]